MRQDVNPFGQSSESDDVRYIAKALDGPFTSAIQAFFRDAVAWPWAEDFPHALFIRDYEHLPEQSPHDIDLLIDKAHQKSFLAHVAKRAAAFDLCCVAWAKPEACFALIFDLDTSRDGRAWAFLESRDSIAIMPGYKVMAGDVEIVRDGPRGLPVPSRDWIAFLYVVQAVRKGRVAKMDARLKAHNIAPGDAADLLLRYTGVKPDFGETLADSVDTLATLRDRLDVVRPAKVRDSAPPPLRTRLSRYLSRRFYFIPTGRRSFYSIHGPDGVGKSTTCTEVKRIFARLPLPFESFHHITGWKYPSEGTNANGREECSPEAEPRVGFVHKLLRTIYRRLPERAQQSYVAVTSYDLYLHKLNVLLDQKFRDGRIVLIDRYIYDLVVRNDLRGVGWGIIDRLFLRLARKPEVAFVLIDRADRIHSRKQELSVTEIESYMKTIQDYLASNRTPIRTINVEGLTPQRVAREVVDDILGNCQPRLMSLLRGFPAGEEHG